MAKKAALFVICITSGGRGGTGKTTFAEVASYVWSRVWGVRVEVVDLSRMPPKPPRANGEVTILDFPAFQLTDRWMVKLAMLCKNIIYVVDEDPTTYNSVERLHVLLRGDVVGVLVNKVLGRPRRRLTMMYRRLGDVWTARFDSDMAVHRAVGVSPLKARGVALADMVISAVDMGERLQAF